MPNRPQPAQLNWDDQGRPVSDSFGDVYFSKASGLEESRYVFLTHNQLPSRWTKINSEKQRKVGARPFRILETGFGTGLNFLCTWQRFLLTAEENAQLEYLSIEKYPLTPDQLRQALALWPELSDESTELLAHYPECGFGFHRFSFASGRIKLTLIIEDVATALPLIQGQIDAWYLDGFAPSKNPDMWSASLFSAMSRLSGPDTTFATFTAAGLVKRGLKGAGFEVEKHPGFGKKRDMLAGTYRQTEGPKNQAQPKPWLSPPVTRKVRPPKTAIVVGAGIAGCSAARSLAEKGVKVTLLESQMSIATGASGNPQGIFYVKLGLNTPEYNAFYWSGLMLSLQRCQEWLTQKDFDRCGVLQLAMTRDDWERQQRLVSQLGFPESNMNTLDSNAVASLTGIKNDALGGFYFPQSGWVHPPALCQAAIQHPNITLVTQAAVSELKQKNEGWFIKGTLNNEQAYWSADAVVIASAHKASTLTQLEHLPLKPIPGQITQWEAASAAPDIHQVLCGQGYIAPKRQGRFCTGASYRLKYQEQDHLEIKASEHQGNLNQLAALIPGSSLPDVEACTGRVSIRAATPDYAPMVGPVLSPSTFSKQYPLLQKNAKHPYTQPASYYPNLAVSIGHGSRGLSSALLSGEIIAAMLMGDPLPVSLPVAQLISPNRFLLRALKQRT